MTDFIKVVVTIDNKEIAKKLANLSIENKIAACCQISGPITSIYRWKGKIETAEEYYCIFKTKKKLFKKLEKLIKSNHPYEVPEIISFKIEKGNATYLNWIADETN